jgi:hypothetical protein
LIFGRCESAAPAALSSSTTACAPAQLIEAVETLRDACPNLPPLQGLLDQ